MRRKARLIGARLTAALVLGTLWTAASAITALADVSSIRLSFSDKYETGVILEPEITCTTSGVEIESIEWSKDVEDWKPGTKVTATILLSSDSGFASSYSGNSLRISGASSGTAKREDGYLKVTAKYYPVVELASPEEAGWSRLNPTKASWSKVDYATGYQVRLYRADEYVRTIDTVSSCVDLAEWLNSESYFYYEVRAIGKDRSDAKYRKASEYTMSSDAVMDDLGDVGGRWRTYNEGKKYQREDGSYVVGQWQQIIGKWYYFDENGYMVTGWKPLNGIWYYMNEDGVMLTAWNQINGIWYYMDSSGAMATGWRETAPGMWYYLNPDGSMAANTVIEGRTLDASGLWVQ